MNADDLLRRLRNGGNIVCTAAMTVEQIAIARAADRLLVDADGIGYAYVPGELASTERTEWQRDLANWKTLAEERLHRCHQLQADWDAEMHGRQVLRRIFGAEEHETMGQWLARLDKENVPREVHESGWQWRPVGDGAYAPPFGTIRVCIGCGCLVAGGPTRCNRCAEERDEK